MNQEVDGASKDRPSRDGLAAVAVVMLAAVLIAFLVSRIV